MMMEVRSREDTLFATEPVGAALQAPLIVVGLPRSGSSFFSHVLSQVPDWYVFDDLYLHRRAAELKAVEGALDRSRLDALLHFLGWQIRARKRSGLYAVPAVDEGEVEPMNAALKQTFAGRDVTWAELQAEWMTRLAHRRGCTRWGYKMPQAFLFIRELERHYPEARFIFLMRDPHKVLASYKFMQPGSGDGDPRQYHPAAHAWYWRTAARAYRRRANEAPERTLLVRFEDLVRDPQAETGRVARFLGAEAPARIEVPERSNSSFGAGPRTKRLTGLETALLGAIAGDELSALGYERQRAPIRSADLADIARSTGRFALYRSGLARGRKKSASPMPRILRAALNR